MNEKTMIQSEIELLEKIKNDIERLDRQINPRISDKIRSAGIKALKVFKHLSVAALPFMLYASMFAGGGYIIGQLSDKNDKRNSDTSKSYEIQNDYTNSNNKYELFIYNDWELNEDGIYKRRIENYRIEDYINPGLPRIDSESSTFILQDTFYEEKPNSAEEDNKKFHIDLDGTDRKYIIILIAIIMLSLTTSISNQYIYSKSGYDFIGKMKGVFKKEKEIDNIEVLRKQLIIRTENFKRLSR